MQLTLENWRDEFLTLYQKPGTWRENEALIEKILELQRQATIASERKDFRKDLKYLLDLEGDEQRTFLNGLVNSKYSPPPESNTEEGSVCHCASIRDTFKSWPLGKHALNCPLYDHSPNTEGRTQ